MPILDGIREKGVFIMPRGLRTEELGIDGANNSLKSGFLQISQIMDVLNKIAKAAQSDGGKDAEIDTLNIEINRLRKQMEEAEEEEEVLEIHQKILERKTRLKKLGSSSSSLNLSATDKTLFRQDLMELMEGSQKDEAAHILNEILDKWKFGINEAIRKIEEYLNDKLEREVSPLKSEIRKLNSSLFSDNEELRNVVNRYTEKQKQMSEIGKRYGVAVSDKDEIEQRIKLLQDENKQKLDEHRQVMGYWGDMLRSFSERLKDDNRFSSDIQFFLPIYKDSCNVVGTSCTDYVLTGPELGYFDVAIIDEVSKATPPELLLPLMKARKAILVGDHRQLPPMFEEHEASYREIVESEDLPEDLKNLLTIENFKRFKNMVTASLFKDMFESADESIKYSLLTQYRMHKDIMDIINRFYDNKLELGLTAEQQEKQKYHGLTIKGLNGGKLIVPENHAYWIDSSELPGGGAIYDSFEYQKDSHRTSAFNSLEFYLIIELLNKLDEANKEAGNEKKSVGIISFYQRQIDELRREVKKCRKKLSSLDIDVNTVDRFQGKEKQIIIVSLVRNNPSARASKHVIAFERINVAFSRAQELLVVVGARHMYENLAVTLPNMTSKGTRKLLIYKNIIDYLLRKGCFKTSAALLPPSMNNVIRNKYNESR